MSDDLADIYDQLEEIQIVFGIVYGIIYASGLVITFLVSIHQYRRHSRSINNGKRNEMETPNDKQGGLDVTVISSLSATQEENSLNANSDSGQACAAEAKDSKQDEIETETTRKDMEIMEDIQYRTTTKSYVFSV